MGEESAVGGIGGHAPIIENTTFRRRVYTAVAAVLLGVVIAGFWNYHFVDGLGQSAFAEPLVGDPGEAANSFASSGAAFGVLFAIAAGLAATFTACNCVVFAMIPGLACQRGTGVDRRTVYRSLATFVGGVVIVGIPYGMFVGFAGPEGIEALNQVRLAQAQAVFTFLGLGLLVWGLAEFGFLRPVASRLSETTRAFLLQPTTRAGIMGLFVGLFAVGRPFPVFRQFLSYAAAAESPLYGAAVMAVQDLGMIAVMVGLLLVMVRFLGDRMTAWVEDNPTGPRMLSGFALLAGGAYFVFYWGLAFAFGVGRWGFKLGIYGA